ncbi:MAG: hypothetical protein RBJ76_22320 [Stenomitos frigidus ULC029]
MATLASDLVKRPKAWIVGLVLYAKPPDLNKVERRRSYEFIQEKLIFLIDSLTKLKDRLHTVYYRQALEDVLKVCL